MIIEILYWILAILFVEPKKEGRVYPPLDQYNTVDVENVWEE